MQHDNHSKAKADVCFVQQEAHHGILSTKNQQRGQKRHNANHPTLLLCFASIWKAWLRCRISPKKITLRVHHGERPQWSMLHNAWQPQNPRTEVNETCTFFFPADFDQSVLSFDVGTSMQQDMVSLFLFLIFVLLFFLSLGQLFLVICCTWLHLASLWLHLTLGFWLLSQRQKPKAKSQVKPKWSQVKPSEAKCSNNKEKRPQTEKQNKSKQNKNEFLKQYHPVYNGVYPMVYHISQ